MKEQAVFQIVNTEYEEIKNIKIDPEYSQLVPTQTEEEYSRLIESIRDVQLYEPIVINQNKVLLDGHHRLRACKELGWVKIPVERKFFGDVVDETIYVIETNVIRRHLTVGQKTKIGMKLEEFYAEKAKDELRRAGKIGRDIQLGVVPNETTPDFKGKAMDQAAKVVGLKPTTYHRAKTVLEKGTAEQKKNLMLGKEKASTLYKNIIHKEKIDTLKEEIPEVITPDGPFDVIVIDPPWQYGNTYDAEGDRSLPSYPTMSLDEIKAIDFKPKDDAILWLWTTNGFLHEAFHLIEHWGFEYKGCLTWAKDKMGLGRWLRNQTEHCLLAVKGKPVIDLKNQTTILHAPNRGHSVKPVEFYDVVDSYCFGVKVDWFARNTREGWVSFGTLENENK